MRIKISAGKKTCIGSGAKYADSHWQELKNHCTLQFKLGGSGRDLKKGLPQGTNPRKLRFRRSLKL